MRSYNETFVSDLTIIDPYSLYLFDDISKKKTGGIKHMEENCIIIEIMFLNT